LAERGHELFQELPGEIREVLASPARQVFLSSYADLQNLPFEILCPAPGEWLGLKQVLPRVHSFQELRAVVPRQPDPACAASAALFADPGGDLPFAFISSRKLSRLLVEKGFQLVPGGKAVLGVQATAKRFQQALESGVVLGVFCGHGEYDPIHGPCLDFAGRTKIWSWEIAEMRLACRPILYYDCCLAGITSYATGGRQIGLGPGALQAGASACLLANRPIFDMFAAAMSQSFFSGVVEGKAAGDALLEARRRIAEKCANPLCWTLPILLGNPDARLIPRQ
jgi:hypothetical protein